MKRIITKLAIVTMVVLLGNSLKIMAQNAPPTPETANVQFVCQEGAVLNLGTPGDGYQWVVKFAAADISTPTLITNLTDNKITGTDVKTGYYIITTKSTATVGGCESDIQFIPVYILPTLVPTFSSADYCTTNALGTTFTASITPTALSGTDIIYQWYTVSETDETKIDGATLATFNPTITNTSDATITATYRLKAAYKINNLIYCPTSVDKTVNVLPKPQTPSITIGNAGQATF